VRALRKSVEQLLERLRREIIVVGDDVLRAEVVQRIRRPAAVRKVRQDGARERDDLILQAQAAQRAEIEEPRFGLARRLVEIRLHAVARRGVALEEIVALRDPQVDHFPIVAGHLTLQILERAARLAVALRAEENQRAAEVPLRIGDDEVLQRSERVARRRGGVAQGNS
jgi:hypothetical protein